MTWPVAVYAVTRQGAALAEKIAPNLKTVSTAAVFLPRRLEPEFGPGPSYFETLSLALTANFRNFKGHVVVGSAGMTVRLIAPLLSSKSLDPAVVILPQNGRYAVSLLSGHLGGGNRLAQDAAEAAGGQAVISTATDIADQPALEVLAREAGLAVENFSRLPYFSRRLAEGEKIAVYDPGGFLTPSLTPWPDTFKSHTGDDDRSEPRVAVDYRLQRQGHLDLILRPRIIFLGLGCHRGVEAAELAELIDGQLLSAGLAKSAVAALATVDSRAEEPALLALSRENGWPLLSFAKEELRRAAAPNPSEKVNEKIGIPSVCEAAALLASQAKTLIIPKRKSRRATLAAALLAAAGSETAGLGRRRAT